MGGEKGDEEELGIAPGMFVTRYGSTLESDPVIN